MKKTMFSTLIVIFVLAFSCLSLAGTAMPADTPTILPVFTENVTVCTSMTGYDEHSRVSLSASACNNVTTQTSGALADVNPVTGKRTQVPGLLFDSPSALARQPLLHNVESDNSECLLPESLSGTSVARTGASGLGWSVAGCESCHNDKLRSVHSPPIG